MTYSAGRSAAAAMLCAALSMRMLWGLAVDYPFAMNGSWMCPIVGFILFLPFIFALNSLARSETGAIWDGLVRGLPVAASKPLEILFSLFLLYDAAVAVRLTASSANIVALNNVTVHLLVVPLILLCAAVVLMGPDAVGGSARIWLKILPIFALILLIVQVKHYRIGWLTPILGGGAGSILNGGLYCAGCMALLSLCWLISVPDRCQRTLLRYTLTPSIAVSLVMLALHMGFPSMISIPFTRAARIELILSNGRMSLSPQLLLDVLWFSSLLQLIAAELCSAAAFLHRAFARLPMPLLAALLALSVGVAAIFNPNWLQRGSRLTRLFYAMIGGILALLVCARLALGSSKTEESDEKA